jgi:hypothetical protein
MRWARLISFPEDTMSHEHETARRRASDPVRVEVALRLGVTVLNRINYSAARRDAETLSLEKAYRRILEQHDQLSLIPDISSGRVLELEAHLARLSQKVAELLPYENVLRELAEFLDRPFDTDSDGVLLAELHARVRGLAKPTDGAHAVTS